MPDIMFLSNEDTQQQLDLHPQKHIIVLNSNATLRSVNQKMATFSFFRFTDFDQVRALLMPTVHDSCSGWEEITEIFINELIGAARQVVDGCVDRSFHNAISLIGYDLSFKSFVKTSFDSKGRAIRFLRTLDKFKITSARNLKEYDEERYTYILIRFASIWDAHLKKLASPHLMALDDIKQADLVIMTKNAPGDRSLWWLKEARLLLDVIHGS